MSAQAGIMPLYGRVSCCSLYYNTDGKNFDRATLSPKRTETHRKTRGGGRKFRPPPYVFMLEIYFCGRAALRRALHYTPYCALYARIASRCSLPPMTPVSIASMMSSTVTMEYTLTPNSSYASCTADFSPVPFS